MAEWIRRLGARRNAPRETVPECMEAKRLGVAYFTPNMHTNAIYTASCRPTRAHS